MMVEHGWTPFKMVLRWFNMGSENMGMEWVDYDWLVTDRSSDFHEGYSKMAMVK